MPFLLAIPVRRVVSSNCCIIASTPPRKMASHPAHNYVNPPTRPPGVQATGVIFIILVTLSLSLRLFTRLRVRGSFGIDDLFATTGTVCLLCSIGYCYRC